MRIMMLLAILTASVGIAGAADQVFFYHTDPAGTPLAMTNASGAVVWQADYKPFGEENTVTTSPKNNKRFVGKEKDEETGLSYFGARYEDARTGRFITVDPVRAVDAHNSKTNERLLANPQRLNPYAYALNNPYRYIDPDGNVVWDILDFAFFMHSAYQFNNEPSWANAGYLAGDTLGLLPVVPALGTIARVGKGIERAVETSAIGAKISHGHAFVKHAHEFKELGIHTREEFSNFVGGIMKNAKGADVKPLSSGRTAYWDTKTGTTVIHDPKHVDAGTAFRPTGGRTYFDNLK